PCTKSREMEGAEPPVNPANVKEVFAVDDYVPDHGDARLVFRRGDRFILESDVDSRLWVVKLIDFPRQLNVPSRLLAKDTDLVMLQWISLDLSRKQAEALLMKSRFETGSFIIIPRKNYSISSQLAILVKAAQPFICPKRWE
ncbi:hypothetical protein PENTCL1PPCAC_24498, partial [Pristionchus entomophagus]